MHACAAGTGWTGGAGATAGAVTVGVSVPLEGHWRRANTPLRQLTPRERLVAIVGCAVTAIAVIALIVATAGNSRPPPAAGCIRAMVPGVMGATELNLCGDRAKRECAKHLGGSDPGSRAIEASCREAGLLKPA
jgi:hypothetical protein